MHKIKTMLKTEFTINYSFQHKVNCFGFSSALLLEFIIQNSNRGNEYIKMPAKEINDIFWCLSEQIIYRSLRTLEKRNIIKSKIEHKDKFDRIKSYTIQEDCFYYFIDIEKFNYTYENNNKVGKVFYDFEDYKNNIKYHGLSKEDYISLLINDEIELNKNIPF